METEYFLIISPDNATQEKLMDEKKRFAQLYNCPQILHSKPHISLVKFFNIRENETRIVQYLHRKIAVYQPFLVDLEGFSAFPTHTIFAKVQTKKQIVNIVKSIGQEKQKLKGAFDRDVHCITEPHITLARSLQHWQYEKGWQEWQHVHFSARFDVREILLLKKDVLRPRFDVVASLPLLGQKNEMVQGALF
ncbi:MAG: 2'-5' RNA ligase family protein [Chitinophagaceae bacterium]